MVEKKAYWRIQKEWTSGKWQVSTPVISPVWLGRVLVFTSYSYDKCLEFVLTEIRMFEKYGGVR